jgi:dipeptidyl aminopeptidase/acylaminoacyl peptidase
MKKELTHKRSHDHLMGENASEQFENQYSNELHITEKTPPDYIAVSSDDNNVNPQNAVRFYDEMRAKGRPVTLHVYPLGGHGWGYQHYDERMLEELMYWLRNREK